MPPSLHPSPSASHACFQQRRRGAFSYPDQAVAWWTGSASFWESTESVPFPSPRAAWGRTSGQTRGPGRQAVKNRPWECLSLHDSASAGPGGRAGRGGLWGQEASSGPGLSSGPGAHVGPAGHLGAGTPDRPCWPPALAGDILTPVHTEEGAQRLGRWALGVGFENGREEARGKCHSVWRWGGSGGGGLSSPEGQSSPGGFLSSHWGPALPSPILPAPGAQASPALGPQPGPLHPEFCGRAGSCPVPIWVSS